jgi:hypothetical protein
MGVRWVVKQECTDRCDEPCTDPCDPPLRAQVNHLGFHPSEEEAAQAYDEAALAVRGPNAATNFAPAADGEEPRPPQACMCCQTWPAMHPLSCRASLWEAACMGRKWLGTESFEELGPPAWVV